MVSNSPVSFKPRSKPCKSSRISRLDLCAAGRAKQTMNRLHSWLSKATLAPLSVHLTSGPGGSHQPEPHEDSAHGRESSAKIERPRARTYELIGARSRLYRSRIVQVNTRWKALAEIYTLHSFAPFWNRIPALFSKLNVLFENR